jgi:four helix bundle protein
MSGVHRHEDLVAWQLASRLSDRIHALLERLPSSKDHTFCEELLEASEAVAANIAEGFDRFTPRQFRYFLQIAKGSLGETTSRIRNGYTRHYWTIDEFNELLLLARRTRGAVVGLIASAERRIAESEQREHRQRRSRQHRLRPFR